MKELKPKVIKIEVKDKEGKITKLWMNWDMYLQQEKFYKGK